jgi:hypothetical protein
MKGDVNLYKGVGKMYVAGFEIGASQGFDHVMPWQVHECPSEYYGRRT